ncbi:unnamed protein product [Brassicogethes aeneus]|uniref:Oxidoreductase-like domain-containing protein n=1 Tax=Brassicogethes aeneus TaxID=1431903 RepID=A0A9P0BGS1_BRAAE|nr:unnamed protein product [Brassicogethes aeneus]
MYALIKLYRALLGKYNLTFLITSRNVNTDKIKLVSTETNNNEAKVRHMVTVEEIETSNKVDIDELPEEPTTCCMSGCANCVWLDYAEKLSNYYRDGGEKAIRDIHEKVTDDNIRAFILLELRMRGKS